MREETWRSRCVASKVRGSKIAVRNTQAEAAPVASPNPLNDETSHSPREKSFEHPIDTYWQRDTREYTLIAGYPIAGNT